MRPRVDLGFWMSSIEVVHTLSTDVDDQSAVL